MSKPATVDDLLDLVARRTVEKQRRKCSGCRVVDADRMLGVLCQRIKREPERFNGLTLRDVWQWSGAAAAKVCESTWTKHLKHHRTAEWAVLATVLPRARA